MSADHVQLNPNSIILHQPPWTEPNEIKIPRPTKTNSTTDSSSLHNDWPLSCCIQIQKTKETKKRKVQDTQPLEHKVQEFFKCMAENFADKMINELRQTGRLSQGATQEVEIREVRKLANLFWPVPKKSESAQSLFWSRVSHENSDPHEEEC